MLGIQAGVATRDAVLMRESPSDHARRYAAAAEFLFELDGISTDRLTAQDRVTHRLLRREFDELRVFYELRAHQRPSLYPMGPRVLDGLFFKHRRDFTGGRGRFLQTGLPRSRPSCLS